ncbi:MAG: exonuclease domain-containing protein [Huintestinicola sp.]
MFEAKLEPEGEAWLNLQVEKEKSRNKSIIASVLCLILAILRLSKNYESVIGYFFALSAITACTAAFLYQMKVVKCQRKYSEYAKERDWQEIKRLKCENELLSNNASFYKSEMVKAQALAEKYIKDSKKAADLWNTRIGQMIDTIDSLKEKNAKLMQENEKLKKKQANSSGENAELPVINTDDIVLDVDLAIDNLEIVDVKIDTENLLAIIRDPEPPLKRKYDFSEECLKGNYISFDLETTGLSPKNDSIIELSAVRFRNFKPVAAFSTLVNPLVDIPATVARITGIHDDDVCDAPLIHEVMQSFTEFIGKDDMVGHNIRTFDLKFLYKFGFEMDESSRSYYDTLSMARKIIPEGSVENNKLETLLDHFGITRSTAHRGLSDSVAEGILFAVLLRLK